MTQIISSPIELTGKPINLLAGKNPLVYPTCAPITRRNGSFTVDAGAGTTFHDVFELQAAAYRVRPIFCNGSAGGTYTVASWKCSSPATITTLDNTAGNWTTGTTPSSGVVPAAPVDVVRRGLLVGDWADTKNTNGTKFVAIRSYVAAGAGAIGIRSSDTGTSITGWATRTDGRARRTCNQATDGVTTLSNFTSTTATDASPCIGVQYQTLEGVITVMKSGDSIDSGRNATYFEESYWDYAAIAAAQAMNLKVEICNMAYASTAYTDYPYHIEDACAAGIIPDIACFPIGSPNGLSTGISDAQIANIKNSIAITVQTCRQYGIVPVIRTWIPSDSPTWGGTGTEAYGSEDSKRRAWNDTLRATKNVIVADADLVVHGGIDSTGQAYIVPAYTTDHIHLNQAGNNAVGYYITPAIYNALLSL